MTRQVQTLERHTGEVWPFAFSPDWKGVATGSLDKPARFCDAETVRAVQALEGHTNQVRSVAFSPDGKRLATGSRDKTARVWDAETGEVVQTLKGHTGDVYSGGAAERQAMLQVGHPALAPARGLRRRAALAPA